MPNAFPIPQDDDAEDVAWGLTTGAALWRQGERYDAIVWLKRAVEAANEAGAPVRADQLNRAATDLIASLAVPPRPSSSASMKAAGPVPPPRPALSSQPSSPQAPSPPSMRKAAPVPPRPPPPPRLKTPPSFVATSPVAEPPPMPGRAPMPSVTTSAPTIDVLTQHAPAAEPAFERADPPPPPTIVPDLDTPTPVVPLVGPEDEITAQREVRSLVEEDEVTAQGQVKRSVEADVAVDVEATPLPVFAPVASATDLASEDAPEEPARAAETAAEVAAETAVETPGVPKALLAALDALPLTPDQKRMLAKTATVESLSAEEDVSVGCLALVIDGQASAQATVSDVTAVAIGPGELLYAQSSIEETLSLRLVAEADPTTIALWDHGAEALLADTPDFVERLKRASDRTQAVAGCTMGPLGEQLDEGLRAVALDKLEVRMLSPNEVIAAKGQPVPGMVIVGVGIVEIEGDNGEANRLGPGDFLFASEVLHGGTAPATARAGSKGAIVLFGGRAAAHELLVTCPPLLEVFAGM